MILDNEKILNDFARLITDATLYQVKYVLTVSFLAGIILGFLIGFWIHA